MVGSDTRPGASTLQYNGLEIDLLSDPLDTWAAFVDFAHDYIEEDIDE